MRELRRRGTSSVLATLDVDEPAFPFRHRIEVDARVHEDRLTCPPRSRGDRAALGADAAFRCYLPAGIGATPGTCACPA
ncbi:MAG: hypothetical protein U0W40_13530 [Acidimicrobiia bacterium]